MATSTIAKQHDVQCPECEAPMVLRASKYGVFYGCSRYPDCKGSHGAHPDGKPMGTPATASVRAARIKAHDAFDRLWKPMQSRMTRTDAYLWMQSALGLSSKEAHIAFFNQAQCEVLIAKIEAHFAAQS